MSNFLDISLNNKYNIEEYYDNKIEDIINYRVED